MPDIDQWIIECRAAVAQAEKLAAQLDRLGGRERLRLGELRLRIANLRAAIDALDSMRKLVEGRAPAEIHPDWMNIGGRSPWCAPGTEG